MEQPQAPAAPVAQFGRYEVLFKIAAGGMAEVYAARMVGEGGFEKMVALKRMLPTLAEDEKFVRMFLDEGRLAANIASPHVVQTLDLGRAEDDSLFLVMELVVGISLSALTKRLARTGTPMPVPVAVEILAQAAQGLHDAHEARTMYGEPLGIVHRDVSPQNVLVDVTGRARITDFGVARALQRMTNTQTGEVKGKLAYFAPEQARAKPIDRRADIFALGIVAWETIAGRRLFAGDNPAEVLMKLMELPVPRLDRLRSDVPPALADAIAGALERDRERRTQTAADFAHALRTSCVPASAAEVGRFVREHGGKSLARLEEGLRSCVTSVPGARAGQSLGKPRLELASGVVPVSLLHEAPTLVTPSASMPAVDPPSVAPLPSASAPLPGASAPPSASAAAPPPARGVSLPVVAAIVVVVGVVAAGGAWLVAHRDPAPSMVARPLPVDPAPAAAHPSPAPSSPSPVLPPPAPPSSPPAAADVEPPRSPRRGPRMDRARPGRDERAERAREPEPTAPAATRLPPAREPEPSVPVAARAEPPPEPARSEPRAPREVRPPDPTPPPRSGGLRGLADFEAELRR
ncbi:MAG TPA: serine/threonine-protein kinase [Sandaracinaceae bacterium]